MTDKVYRDSSGELYSLVTVSEIRGCWIAKSDSPACEKDVNDILQKMPYSGAGDVQKITEQMKQSGFEKATPDPPCGSDPCSSDPRHGIIFEHVATTTAR